VTTNQILLGVGLILVPLGPGAGGG
jgi:hypothetical protein